MTIGSKSLTLSVPTISFANSFSFLSDKVRQTYNDLSSSSQSAMNNGRRMGRDFMKNKVMIFSGVILILLVVIVILAVKSSANSSDSSSDSRPTVQKPLATQTLNKSYSFPIKDANGKEVSKFTYTIESAELRNEIILNGQRVPTVQGRTMLILNVKLTNDYTKPASVNARDYVRLTMNGKTTERLAPDIHNDPVNSQAMSTEPTRVGFFINDTDKDLVLSVGQYVGDDSSKKEQIKLTLKK